MSLLSQLLSSLPDSNPQQLFLSHLSLLPALSCLPISATEAGPLTSWTNVRWFKGSLDIVSLNRLFYAWSCLLTSNLHRLWVLDSFPKVAVYVGSL